MSDILWQEVAALRERVKQIELNHELLVKGIEQRFAAYDRALGAGVPTAPPPARMEGD